MRFAMRTWDLDTAPPFVAISYSWGAEEPVETILVNERPLHVRENCRYALWQASLHFRGDRYFWIDAICINQYDLVEKAIHVNKMYDIYYKAECVLMCIGAHANGSAEVIRAARGLRDRSSDPIMKRIEDIQHEELTSRHRPDHVGFAGPAWTATVSFDPDINRLRFATSLADGDEQPFNIAYKKLASRSYWCRIWIVQEVLAAKAAQLLCGSDSLSLKELEHLRRLMVYQLEDRTKHEFYPEELRISTLPMDRVLVARELLQPSSIPQTFAFTLTTVLSRYSSHFCADPRDRIYGFLRLLEHHKHLSPLTADYTITPLALAKRALQHLHDSEDLSTVRELCDALEVLPGADDVALKHFVMSNGTAIQSFEAALSLVHVNRPQSQLPMSTVLWSIANACRVEQSASGHLFAALTLRHDVTRRDVDLYYDGQYYSRYHWHGLYSCQDVTNVAAHICGTAQSGDVLVRLRHLDPFLCLVLRQREQNLYELMGEAALTPKYRVCEGGGACRCYSEAAELKHRSLDLGEIELHLPTGYLLACFNELSKGEHILNQSMNPATDRTSIVWHYQGMLGYQENTRKQKLLRLVLRRMCHLPEEQKGLAFAVCRPSKRSRVMNPV